MQKITVMIAEDEPPIARFIKTLTENREDFLVEAMCGSTEEALEKLQQREFQLLITDIRMAGATGLELIREIRKKNRRMRILIISGYKMFEYAREAVKLDIEDYITKPIDPEEFDKALNQVRQFFYQEEFLVKEAALEKALKNKDGELFSNSLSCESMEFLILYHSGDLEEHLPEVEKMRKDFFVFSFKNAIVCIRPVDAEKPIQGDSILRKILNLQNGTTAAGILVEHMNPGPENVNQIRELYRAVRKLAVFGKRCHAFFSNYESVEVKEKTPEEELVRKLLIDVKAENRKEFYRDFDSLFDLWEKEEVSLYQTKRVLHTIVEALQQTSDFAEESIAVGEYVDDCVYYADSFAELRRNILLILEEGFAKEERESRHGKAGRELFERIVAVIEKNPGENYALREISSMFGVSQPYIRKLFKGYTGMTYNEYVLKDKLKLACTLMKVRPDILVKEVAEAIGFEQLYFSTVFNKYMGVSPSQYKQKLAEK